MRKGTHHTSESRMKLRIAHTGKKQTEEHRRKRGLSISIGLTGRKLSKQHCSNISISLLGFRHSEHSILKMKKNQKKIVNIPIKEYSKIHKWARKNMTKLVCQHCLSPENLDCSNKSGLYRKEMDDWMILCRKCHKKYDNSFTEDEIENGRSYENWRDEFMLRKEKVEV